MPPHFLVIEGNTETSRRAQLAAGGVVASDGYAALLRLLAPGAAISIVMPADADAALPASLEAFDGAVITGSALHSYWDRPEVTRQIALVRAVLASGTPVFGSCWGLQLIAVAAGGVVRRNPRGRELGIARNIVLTDAGRAHAMYAGKASAFSAMTVHLDEVETLPPGATLLATNAFSRVQSFAIESGGASAWGTQYHPEYPLREVAAIVRRTGHTLVEEGFFADDAAQDAFSQDLATLDACPTNRPLAWRYGVTEEVLDPALRTREIANWIASAVRPRQAARGRG